MGKRQIVWLSVLSILMALFTGCDGARKTAEDEIQELAQLYKPVFPEEKPFNAQEWQTNTEFPWIGDPNAKKGGTLVYSWANFPPTLRTDGPNTRLAELSLLHDLTFQTLIDLHPNTLEFIPKLAKYWKISDDKQTFHFRIDPRARWADGSEVTSDDVLASWEHRVSEDRKDPYNTILYNQSFEKPVVHDKYTVSVKTKALNWRLFIYFGASMRIYPAKYLRLPVEKYEEYYGKKHDGNSPLLIPGEKYLQWYQWRPMMGSGPYQIALKEMEKEKSISLLRRKDCWSVDERWSVGLYNFDRLKWIVVLDDDIKFEKFKKGDLDYFYVAKALQWVKETDFDKVQNGWIQKRKIYNQCPQGFSGFALNMRRPPFNDKRVRQAFAYLFNREKLIDKLFFNEYEYIDSYHPGSVWENPNNPKIRYNPEKAAQLLAEAGWSKRNEQGWLVNEKGEVLQVTLEFGSQSMERIFTVVREDFQKAGILFELKLIDYRTLLKKVEEHNFTLHFQNWTGLVFPNPESSWMSKLADEKHSNNMPGLKNQRLDELCQQYNVIFERQKQIELVREIDGIIFNEYPYALAWYANYNRLMFWNKFGHPSSYVSKTREFYYDVPILWWYDPDKDKLLQEATKTNGKLPVGETLQRPWKSQ